MGYQITEPTAGSTDWTDFSTIVNFSMKGFMGASLTNYDTTDVPLIAAGSKVEVAGAMYYFATTEAITGSLSTNQNYIMVTTSSSSISVSYTTDVPTWVPSKNGWYEGSPGAQRYIGGLSSDPGGKWVYNGYPTGVQTKYESVGLVGSEGANVTAAGHSINWSSGSAGNYLGQVDLPQGAKVIELYGYCLTYNGHQITITLEKGELTDGVADIMATVSHTGTGAQTDTTIVTPIIDHSDKKYWVKATTGASGSGNTIVTAIRIKYLEVQR